MLIARITVVVIALIGILLAWNPDSSVFRVVSFAWAGFGAAFGPTMLLALFDRRSTLQGALAGMIAGGAMIYIWKFAIAPMGGLWSIYELLPAFLIALVVNLIVSRLTPQAGREVLDVYDQVMAEK